MILYINTKDAQIISVAIKDKDRIVAELSDHNKFGSQVLLPLIKRLLSENNLEFKNLRQIEVETGPGSYTGIKVGTAVANALGFSLGIPVNGKEIETELKYT